MAKELEQFGVGVTLVMPGAVKTPNLQKVKTWRMLSSTINVWEGKDSNFMTLRIVELESFRRYSNNSELYYYEASLHNKIIHSLTYRID